MGEMLSQAEIEALLNGKSLPDSQSGSDETSGSDESPDSETPPENEEIIDSGLAGGVDSQPGPDAAQTGADAGFTSDSDTASDSEIMPPAQENGASGQPDDDDKVFIIGENPDSDFTREEIDALGEIGNISMGNSATTLFSLLNRKVNITTPSVSVSTLRQIASSYKAPLVVVRVEYTEGLFGSNMLVLKESDVMVITDLMMGGDGSGIQGELTDLHLSAISEAMNQMIGNASTSLSNVFDTKIDISPPNALSVKINDGKTLLQIINIDPDEKVAVVSFNMIVENLLDTMIMQIQPLSFAKDMINNLINSNKQKTEEPAPGAQQQPAPTSGIPPQAYPQAPQYAPTPQGYPPTPPYAQAPPQYAPSYQYINVQPANFQPFEEEPMLVDKKNIGLVMDLNLEVSVELGKTHKLIREILEFGQGSIIELDKLAGEPVDILVNGKNIAKGEVVVIDESFGVRVTDIIHPSKRI